MVADALMPLRMVKRSLREPVRLFRILTSGNYRFLQFAPPGHFYSAIPDVKELRHHDQRVFDQRAVDLPGIDIRAAAQRELGEQFASFYQDLRFPTDQQVGHRYFLDNEYFSYGDAVTLYSMMRLFRPQRIMEVGSGYSSAAMLDVDEAFFGGTIGFTFIEPFPARLQSLLKGEDRSRCKVIEQPVQNLPVGAFTHLRENDFLFIDSSHVAKADSDVLYLMFEVLPALQEGVIVHIHDIPWPFQYPRNWIYSGRAWNEAYFLRAFLQYNPAFEILYFNSYMEIHQREFLEARMPLALGIPSSPLTPGNTSLWLRKRAC